MRVGRAGSSGQAAIEAVLAFPLCLVCAWAIVDTSVVFRDQLALEGAASAAAVAHIDGTEATRAATRELPGDLARDLTITATDTGLTLTSESRSRTLSLLPNVRLRADAITATKDMSA